MNFITATVVSLFISLTTAAQCNEANSIVNVSKRKTGRTEFVIFTIKKPSTVLTAVENVTPPFTEDPSGNTVAIGGCKYKKVRFKNVAWQCRIPLQITTGSYLVNSIKKTSQFEGIIEFIIGYKCNTTSVETYSYTEGDYKKFVVRFKY
ncbi:MAG TPA: hypothetical protein VF623_06075 [Segetibacter sp.]